MGIELGKCPEKKANAILLCCSSDLDRLIPTDFVGEFERKTINIFGLISHYQFDDVRFASLALSIICDSLSCTKINMLRFPYFHGNLSLFLFFRLSCLNRSFLSFLAACHECASNTKLCTHRKRNVDVVSTCLYNSF